MKIFKLLTFSLFFTIYLESKEKVVYPQTLMVTDRLTGLLSVRAQYATWRDIVT